MIGQEKLKSNLFLYSINEFPHSLLLVGDVGCGKHTMIKELASYYNVDAIDITDNISLELINDISLKSVVSFYVIDADKITERQQNVILKFLEEPNEFTYIILITTNKTFLLNTVVNRCITYDFDKYTKEQLEQFVKDETNKDKILEVCTTPGQVMSISNNLNDVEKLCKTMVEKMKVANYSNALSIVNKVNLKDEYDKFDINVLFNMLLLTLFKYYQTTKDEKYFKMYNFVSQYRKKLRDFRLNKELFFENFLTSFWRFVR